MGLSRSFWTYQDIELSQLVASEATFIGHFNDYVQMKKNNLAVGIGLVVTWIGLAALGVWWLGRRHAIRHEPWSPLMNEHGVHTLLALFLVGAGLLAVIALLGALWRREPTGDLWWWDPGIVGVVLAVPLWLISGLVCFSTIEDIAQFGPKLMRFVPLFSCLALFPFVFALHFGRRLVQLDAKVGTIRVGYLKPFLLWRRPIPLGAFEALVSEEKLNQKGQRVSTALYAISSQRRRLSITSNPNRPALVAEARRIAKLTGWENRVKE